MLGLIQQFVHYSLAAEATFTSTERIRYYIQVGARYFLCAS